MLKHVLRRIVQMKTTIEWNNFIYDETEYGDMVWEHPLPSPPQSIDELKKAIELVWTSDEKKSEKEYALMIIDQKRSRTMELYNYEIDDEGNPSIFLSFRQKLWSDTKIKRGFLGKKKKYVKVLLADYSSDRKSSGKPMNKKAILQAVTDFYEGKDTFGNMIFDDSIWVRVSNDEN